MRIYTLLYEHYQRKGYGYGYSYEALSSCVYPVLLASLFTEEFTKYWDSGKKCFFDKSIMKKFFNILSHWLASSTHWTQISVIKNLCYSEFSNREEKQKILIKVEEEQVCLENYTFSLNDRPLIFFLLKNRKKHTHIFS